jgi:hypothetical protein
MLSEKEGQKELLSALSGIENELKGIKKKGAKQVLQIILSIVLALIIGLGAGIICGRNWNDIKFNLFPNQYSQSTTKILEEKLTKQAKLNTALYEQTSEYESEKLFDNKIQEKLHLSKSMKFTYTGYVEAGVRDLSEIKINVNSKTNVITISNIKIDITNVYIDPSSIKDVEQTKNIFNQLTIDDFTRSQESLEKKLKEDAINDDVIGKARKNCEKTLNNLFGTALNGYTVVYEWVE